LVAIFELVVFLIKQLSGSGNKKRKLKMKKVVVMTVLSLSALGLVACSARHGPSNVPITSADAQAYALPGQPNFHGNEYAYYKNPLRAPSNQVYYFQFDSSKMRPEDFQALKIQASYLVAHPNAVIRLEGNTDNRGSREYNVALGWRRNQSVVHLLAQQGVRTQQIQTVSYGKEHPVVIGNTERIWALNRRVNLVYKVK
jgi:peptidoglycan-associated lipoprotein